MDLAARRRTRCGPGLPVVNLAWPFRFPEACVLSMEVAVQVASKLSPEPLLLPQPTAGSPARFSSCADAGKDSV